METISKDESKLINSTKIETSDGLFGFFQSFLITPLKNGIAGFAAFFVLILVTKLFAYIVGFNSTFSLDIEDVLYSLIGFVLIGITKFMENFSKDV